MIAAPELDNPALSHGFFTRDGGHSTGLYASLNCGLGSDDDRQRVINNRAMVAERLEVAPDHLLTVYQVHSPDVACVTEPFSGPLPKVDAMVTTAPGLALGILTADCAPVLFADTKAGVIGAAHAGWKGAITGVLEATVAAMIDQGAKHERITAVIGPTISRYAYEVGPEFVMRFSDEAAENESLFHPSERDGHAYFDLSAYCLKRLRNAEVGTVADLGICTYSDEDRFFSYRRTTHRGEPDYGRQISAIALRP